MAITTHRHNPYGDRATTETSFEGRVVRVVKTVEIRNWSDTLDYTDRRSTNCTWALVWLGTHGVPPKYVGSHRSGPNSCGEGITYVEHGLYGDQPRELEYFEQFAWIDCTNLFSDRNGSSLTAEADGAHGLFGEPLMWANLIAWEGYHNARREREARELQAQIEAREEEDRKRAAKAAAREAAKEAKLEATKAAAEAALARIPQKGTTVTVDGFTGTVFWKGMSPYRGAYSARAGVRDARGEVRWIGAENF